MTSAGDRVQVWSESAAGVLAHVRAALGFEMAVVSRRAGEDYVVLGADDDTYGVSLGDVLPWADTFCARVADGRAPSVVPDISQVPAFVEAAELLGMDVGAYVSLPLRDETGALLGTLCAASPERRDAALHAQRPLLELLARLLGALLSAELRVQREVRRSEQAELAALVDPLTGLGNRRLWDRRLAAEEARCAAYGLSAVVVALDLDGLKAINDDTGHEAGDELIRFAADALREVAGPDDVVARTGGDEFAVLLPESTAARIDLVVPGLRGALTARGISAGIGAAVRGPDGLPAAWRRADALLLEDKREPAHAEQLRRPSSPAPHRSDDVLVQELLDLARRQLGAAIAFVGEWRDGVRVMRAVSSAVPVGVGRGATEPLEDTYCQRIVDGRLPRVIPDTAAEPEAVTLPVTAAVPIGSYVGVPVVLSDGQLYGTLCCLSPTPAPELSERDADFLAAIAASMARVVEAELAARSERSALVARLDPVLRGSGVSIVYQPVVHLSDGRLAGVEALARFGLQEDRSPSRWFADAAAVGMTRELELVTARLAIQGARDLPGFLALNLSAATICDPAFAELLAGVDPARIVVEVSEHEEVADYAPVLAALSPLRARGLQVAVDDAGAGFASLRHVVLLSPDIIKLDISLVCGIDRDPTRQALAAALTTFAHSTGAQVVAEGVESEQEREVLRVAGVGLEQGWLCGAAVPSEDVVARYGRRAVLPTPRSGGSAAALSGS